MTAEATKLVVENHNLIYFFINKHRLDLDEWYGCLAEALCKAGETYHEDISKFSTYAMVVMYRAYQQKLKYDIRKKRIIWKHTTLCQNIWDCEYSYTDQELYDTAIWNEIAHSKTYGDIVVGLSQGKTKQQIANELGITVRRINKVLKQLRKEYELDGEVD